MVLKGSIVSGFRLKAIGDLVAVGQVEQPPTQSGTEGELCSSERSISGLTPAPEIENL